MSRRARELEEKKGGAHVYYVGGMLHCETEMRKATRSAEITRRSFPNGTCISAVGES